MTLNRRYRYVGPAEIRDQAVAVDTVAVDSADTLARWLAEPKRTEPKRTERKRAELTEPVTFVVLLGGGLMLAPRRSEHVALARGQDVLAAGEMTFGPTGSRWRVVEVTNQSTGYCPDPDCWPAVRTALDQLGIRHPGDFTEKVVFRLCPSCGERNIVRDGDFTCALCDSGLPSRWNFPAA